MSHAHRLVHRSCPGHPRAFTLVELLFVMGIIVVVAAILLPAVTQSRRQAKLATCANQLHQIHVASQTWKVKYDPQPLAAAGWRQAYTPLVEDTTIYNCPESAVVLAGGGTERRSGDSVGSGSSSGGSSGVSGSSGSVKSTDGSSAARPSGDLKDVYVRTTNLDTGKSAMIKLTAESPWVKKTNDTGDSYDLWLEHQFLNNGTKDFDDVGVRFTKNADGSVTMELLPRKDGHMNYQNDVGTLGDDGQLDVAFANAYGQKTSIPGTKPPAATILSDETEEFSDRGNETDNAGAGGTGGSGSSTSRPGYGTASDYGINLNVARVDGQADKVYGMDYTYSIIKPNAENWASIDTSKSDGVLPFARHLRMANVLYGDGSVRPVRISTTHLNPAFGTNLVNLWDRK